ncbi:MAG: pyruvate kinase [Bacteroidia bacterium]|nr:pyruvate kinase [Bacteroidia bacterium]
MFTNTEKIRRMIAKLDELISAAREMENRYSDVLEKIHPQYRKGARNLLHYRALRENDIRSLQRQLGNLGLSRLARAENHVMTSLLTTRSILRGFLKSKQLKLKRSGLSIKEGRKRVNANARALLGQSSSGRRTRIMVTQPSEAAMNPRLVSEMMAAGMNTIRINCAHDDPQVWEKLIHNARKAAEKARRQVKITMDLAGPKIRTGAVAPGPQIVRLRTTKNLIGQVVKPAKAWLSPLHPPEAAYVHLPLPKSWMENLEVGHRLILTDTRGKNRVLIVTEKHSGGVVAEAWKNIYITTGTEMRVENKPEISPVNIGYLPPVEQTLLLTPGETLILHATPEPGENALRDASGEVMIPAHISCTSKEIFGGVKPGQRILFDDGKISGLIQKVDDDRMEIKISPESQEAARLGADKGINFPDTNLGIRGLTEKDREDLKFVAAHADVVNMSFVNSPEDVEDLLDELRKNEVYGKVGIILKIETKQAYSNLMDILLAGMQTYPVGVMIARGDLAIETGWENIGYIQEEILWMCQAAHLPDIWATQVLENLAKKGLPSRAEISDATMAQRAECVMLNKGPYIVNAIRLLDTILRNMDEYQEKKTAYTPPMAGLLKR